MAETKGRSMSVASLGSHETLRAFYSDLGQRLLLSQRPLIGDQWLRLVVSARRRQP